MRRFPKASPPIDKQAKSAVLTNRVISMNFHEVLDVPSSDLTSERVPWQDFAYIHNFHSKCQDKFDRDICQDLMDHATEDETVAHYDEDLTKNVQYVLDQLQLT